MFVSEPYTATWDRSLSISRVYLRTSNKSNDKLEGEGPVRQVPPPPLPHNQLLVPHQPPQSLPPKATSPSISSKPLPKPTEVEPAAQQLLAAAKAPPPPQALELPRAPKEQERQPAAWVTSISSATTLNSSNYARLCKPNHAC